MKTLLVFLGSILLLPKLNAQIFSEDFKYSGLLTDNGWTSVDISVTGNPVQTTSQNLTFPNYHLNQGNACLLLGQASSQDVYQFFQPKTKLYYSLLINIPTNSYSRTGYFAFLGKVQGQGVNGTLNGNYLARLVIKTNVNGGWQIGVSNWSLTNITNPPLYNEQTLLFDKTYVVIVSFDYNNNKTIKLWIRDDTFPATEIDAGPPNVIFIGAATTAALPTEIDALALRQHNDIPNCIVDGIMVFENWNAFVLPLKLLSFNGVATNSHKMLKWTTDMEYNVSHFEIEKSKDGKIFETITSISCKNGSGLQEYIHYDRSEISLNAYYRLKIVDLDKRFEYSEIIFLNGQASEQMKIAVLGGKQIIVKLPNSQFKILKIISIGGQMIKTININPTQYQYTFNLSNVPIGAYIIVLENSSEKETQKFMLY